MVRMSAEERRESVIRAAMKEFARTGYVGTSTEVIARRVGVSQPYLFRLFPSKQAIFLAAAQRGYAEWSAMFREVAEGLQGKDALDAMATAYQNAIAREPDRLLLQMQVYAAVAAAEASGDHAFGDSMRASWLDLFETARELLGGDMDEALTFMAHGMLINTLMSLGFPADHPIWSPLYESGKPRPHAADPETPSTTDGQASSGA